MPSESGASAAMGVPEPSSQPEPPRNNRRRAVAMVVLAVAFAAQWFGWGLPTDSVLIFAWLGLVVVCWNIDHPRRYLASWLRDWGPILALLLIYDFSRGLADNQRVPHAMEMIDGDRFLFRGHLPTLWLQQHLYDPDHVHWWDVLASFTYMSHFVASLTVAVVLWMRTRPQWASFMRRWFFLTAIGLTTYFVYPAAPPWWASQFGYFAEHVERLSSRGWGAIGLDGTGSLLSHGQSLANPVAAMPSLHAAFTLLIALFFMQRTRKRWWPLLAAYPLAMAFTLVYCGEHYVTDILVGWTYVGMTFLLVGVAEHWWRGHKERQARRAHSVSTVDTSERQLAGSALHS